MAKKLDVFKYGSTWVRADFHLHTKADTEFDYKEDENYFVSNYVDQLEAENIRVACITNHNKFDWEEYKAIKKTALKKEIYVLPGVELSVNDGNNGIHTCVIFNPDQWLGNGNDFINQFLTQTFAGKENFQNENGRSNDNLLDTIKTLNNYDKSYFMIMAHVEAKSGLFEELGGGRVKELGQNKHFKKSVLGFQKVRTRDEVKKWKSWLGELPAFVEGSDAKCIEDIGRGNQVIGQTQKTYLKIGDFNFDAIRYALLDQEYRVAAEVPEINNAYIQSIAFTGGKLDGQTVYLHHAMNNLIGVRGSGKSSLLEAIRYALDIDLNDRENVDKEYKDNIVRNTLGNSGKMVTTIIDEHNNTYRLEKILGDSTSIYKDEEYRPSLKPEHILKKPIYYGQKDLSKIGSTLSIETLIDQLTGHSLREKRNEIHQKSQEVIATIESLKKYDERIEKKPDVLARKAELEERINVFKEHKIDQKLKEQVNYNQDDSYLTKLQNFQKDIIRDLRTLINDYESQFQTRLEYPSKSKSENIELAQNELKQTEKTFLKLKEILKELESGLTRFNKSGNLFKDEHRGLKEDFAEIERSIDIPNIKTDDYLKFTKNLDIVKARLTEYDKLDVNIKNLRGKLDNQLEELGDLWYQEYKIIQDEIKKVNDDQKAIKIEVDYRANKDMFLAYLKESLRGSNIYKAQIESIAENYNDLIQVYKDLRNEKNRVKDLLSETSYVAFKRYLNENMESFLTYRVPDKFDIIYNDRSIKDHSLGQRSSALIIFLLTLKESDIIIIDQPEDDLDNQTIYKDVIKVLRELKNNTQFVFATHNPNIPVLGDAEQVISCRYDRDKIEVNPGSIDKENIQQEIINIMEGGEEAFDNRKRIYDLWKH